MEPPVLEEMEEDTSWLDDDLFRSACQSIRSSLLKATRLRSEHSAEDDSTATSTSTKVSFECGYAKYSESTSSWILRHRANAVTWDPSHNDSLDSLSSTGTDTLPSTPLRMLNAKRVAKIRPNTVTQSKDVVGGHDDDTIRSVAPSPPPLEMVQFILRSVELASMLAEARFAVGKRPPEPPRCSSRVEKDSIDLEPVLSFVERHSSRKRRRSSFDLLLDGAIRGARDVAAEHVATHFDKAWNVVVDGRGSTNVNTDPAVAMMQQFVRCCLGLDTSHGLSDVYVEEKRVGTPQTSRKTRPYLDRFKDSKDNGLERPFMVDDSSAAALSMSTPTVQMMEEEVGSISVKAKDEEGMGSLSAVDLSPKEATVDGATRLRERERRQRYPARQRKKVPRYSPTSDCSLIGMFGKTHDIPREVSTRQSSPARKERKRVKRDTDQHTVDTAPLHLQEHASKDMEDEPGYEEGMEPNAATEQQSIRSVTRPRYVVQEELPSAKEFENELSRQAHSASRVRRSVAQVNRRADTMEDSNRHSTISLKRERPTRRGGEKQRSNDSQTITPKTHTRLPGRNELTTTGATSRLRRSPRKQLRWIEDEEATPPRRLSAESSRQIFVPPQTSADADLDSGTRPVSWDEGTALGDKTADKVGTPENCVNTSGLSKTTEPPSKRKMSRVESSRGPLKKWVKLSHIGHVSDYHGIQRKHDTFLPLRFNKSVSETREEIEETLAKSLVEGETESDAEFANEMSQLEDAMNSYAGKAEIEKKGRRKKAGRQSETTGEHLVASLPQDAHETLLGRPVLFDRAVEHEVKESDLEVCPFGGERYENVTIPCRSFREVESEPTTTADHEEESGKRRRSSRTSKLNEVKKVSILMLNELRHTLAFIEEFNRGPNGKSIGQDEEHMSKKRKQDKDGPMDTLSLHGIAASQETARAETNMDGAYVMKLRNRQEHQEETRVQMPVDPTLFKLSHSQLLNEYDVATRHFRKVFAFPRQDSTELMIETVKAVIDGQGNEIVQSEDEGVVSEQKAFIRIARGYNRKADQERIEKKEHEEERKLKLREFEYLNRSKKSTAEDLELSRFETRPVLFGSDIRDTRNCKFGPECWICNGLEPVVDPEDVEAEQEPEKISHPAFRQVDLTFDDLEAEQKGRRSRARSLNRQRVLAFERLQELEHNLEFIEAYNKGWIVTEKRRK